MRVLEHKGVIRIEAGRSRGITLTALSRPNLPASNTVRTPLPLVGRVAAGSPILAQENIEHEYRVDASLFSARPHYLLRVEGSSMRDAGILDGDLLAVHRTPEAHNGQIVLSVADTGSVCCRKTRSSRQYRLTCASRNWLSKGWAWVLYGLTWKAEWWHCPPLQQRQLRRHPH